MGNMTVINANYDVKTAITRDMKNSLIRVFIMIKCVKYEFDAYEGVLKCQFLNFKPKSKWKKIKITLEKGFIFCPSQVFLAKF